MPNSCLQIIFNVRMLSDQREEIVAAEPQEIDRCAAPDRCGALPAVEQSKLTEFVAGAQRLQGQLLALLGLLDYARAARGQNVEGIGIVSLADDNVAEFMMLLAEQLVQRVEVGVGDKPQER